MTTTEPTTDSTDRIGEPAWLAAGRAWEHAPTDWAFLFEPYARDAVEEVCSALGVGPGTDLLDVACGSGAALARAARLGASVAGIDAAPKLLEIARRRTPDADLVAGSMFELPWDDDRFDAVTSFNGIWGGCDDAVAEMARVVRPGGRVALTFWGSADRLDLVGYFMALGSTMREVADEMVDLARISAPGTAEHMLEAAGLEVVAQGTTAARLEWPDDDVAWRALRSPGVAVPPLETVGEGELRRLVLEAVAEFRGDDGSDLLTNELVHVVAVRPG